jgi:hypothetical protein
MRESPPPEKRRCRQVVARQHLENIPNFNRQNNSHCPKKSQAASQSPDAAGGQGIDALAGRA